VSAFQMKDRETASGVALSRASSAWRALPRSFVVLPMSLGASMTSCFPRRRLDDAPASATDGSTRCRRIQDEPPVNPAPPDAMFRSEDVNALRVSAAAWLGHMKYIVVACAAVTMTLYSVIHAVHAKCSRGLTLDVFELEGQTEITRRWHRCYNPNFSDDPFHPLRDWGSWNIYLVRMTRLWSSVSTDNAFFAHMCAWNLMPATRTWNTSVYFLLFAGFFVAPLLDYELTGYKHISSWAVSFACWVGGWIAVARNSQMRDPGFHPFWWGLVYCGFGGITYVFAISFLNVSGSPRYSIELKLLIRFVIDPLLWETMKASQRHIALLNPSPGPGLNTPGFMGPIINQAVYSRLLLFMMTNDGELDLITIQIIISLNELILSLTLKHRDAFFTRTVMGTVTADAILSSEKSDEMHGVSCLTNTYCELGAVMFLTPLMAVFNLPSSPDLDDPSETRTADYKRMGYQALQLIALEVVLSFVTTFAQFRFHDIDLARVFRRAERKHAADAKTRPLARVFTYRFWVYALMSVFFSMCVVGTVLGTLWSTAVCPRVRRSDGHVYFSFCEPEEGKHFPGGAPSKGGGIVAMHFDWPPWKSPYSIDTSNPGGES